MPAAKPKPAVPDALQKEVFDWTKLVKAANAAIEAERAARQALAAKLMPTVKEGKTTFMLPADWKLELDQKFNRTLDQQGLPAAIAEMRTLEIQKLGVTIESLFKYSADVVVSGLRLIEDAVAKEKEPDGPAHQIYEVLSMVMTTKPGLPSMKVIAPGAK